MPEKISLLCFGASYAVTLLFELVQVVRPRRLLVLLGTGFAAAGLFAHTIFLMVQRPSLSTSFGSMLFLAWILAVFALYGSVHHRRQVWAVFVLPVVLGLIAIAALCAGTHDPLEHTWISAILSLHGERFWGSIHGGLLLLAAVGISVGFVASIMYLVHAHQLKTKALPTGTFRMLSQERLEEMNRRAINLAFPLLTVGMLVGAVLGFQGSQATSWLDPKVVSTMLLWLTFVLVLYLRYGVHLRGTRLAWLTVAAFAILIVTLVLPHSFVGGAPR